MKVFTLLAAALMAAAPVAAAPRAPTALRIERFEISFLYKDSRSYEEYAAVAVRGSDVRTGEIVRLRVWAGIRPCSLDSDGALTCRGDLLRQEVIRFKTADDMSKGMLSFRDAAGRVSEVSLRAADPYAASGRSIPNECGGATLQRYEYAFNAKAAGTIFGRKVTTSGDVDPEDEAMTRYVELKACP